MDTLGKVGGAFTQPFTGDRMAENLFTLAGIAAPRVRLSNTNQPWRQGEGEGLRQSLLAMGQFTSAGRETTEEQDILGRMVEVLSGKSDVASLKGLKIPEKLQPIYLSLMLKEPELRRQRAMEKAMAGLLLGGPQSAGTPGAQVATPSSLLSQDVPQPSQLDAFGLSEPTQPALPTSPSAQPRGTLEAPSKSLFGDDAMNRLMTAGYLLAALGDPHKGVELMKGVKALGERQPPTVLPYSERGGEVFDPNTGLTRKISGVQTVKEHGEVLDKVDQKMLDLYRQLAGTVGSVGGQFTALLKGSEGAEAAQIRLKLRQLGAERQRALERYYGAMGEKPPQFPLYTFGNMDLQKEILKDVYQRFGIAYDPKAPESAVIPENVKDQVARFIYDVNRYLSMP